MASAKLGHPYKTTNTNINHAEMWQALEKRKREIPLKIFRKKVIDHQNKMNYQNEYDRIRSHLSSNSILLPNARAYLLKRKAFLSSLGAVDDGDRIK